MKSISVVGLGKLGLGFAAHAADCGVKTIGIDHDERVISAIESGQPRIYEPGLKELLLISRQNLKVTSQHSQAIAETDTTFILVPTPSSPDGRLSAEYVKGSLQVLAQALSRSTKPYHLFVVSSTLMPGCMEQEIIPLIEQNSQRQINQGFGVCYNPELVALGNVLYDFAYPDLVLIGQSDKQAGDLLQALYQSLCPNDPPIFRMSFLSAEIAKISLNVYVSMKISFANMLANVCEHFPDADVDAITAALGADRRISPHYFRGGPAYGGNCFPRDISAFLEFAKSLGSRTDLIQDVQELNEYQNQHLLNKVMGLLSDYNEKKVSVLGLAFKPGTQVITHAPAVNLIHGLLEKQVEVSVFDPLAMEAVLNRFGDALVYASSIQECTQLSPVCVVTTPADEFKIINKDYFSFDSASILDCWRILDPQHLGDRIRYVALGKAEC